MAHEEDSGFIMKINFIFVFFFALFMSLNGALYAAQTNDSASFLEVFDNSGDNLSNCSSNFLITPLELLGEIQNGKHLILIDVRGKKDFAQFRINQSINIPLYALKTKKFLKNEKIILVNKGFDSRLLVEECEKLRQAGFGNVLVLDGGLKGWRDAGGRLEGDFFEIQKLDNITPRQIASRSNVGCWLAVDIATEKSIDNKSYPETFIHIPFTDNEKAFIDQIRDLVTTYRDMHQPNIVMMNASGDGYDQVKKLLRENEIRKVFFLKGGVKGLHEFMKDHTAMLESKEKRIKKCASCP